MLFGTGSEFGAAAAREAGFRRILQPRDGGYLPRDCIGVSTLQEAAEAAFADG